MRMKIISCKDSQLWYNNMIGQTINVINTDHFNNDICWTLQPSGYRNIVYIADLDCIECQKEPAQAAS